MDRKVLTLGLVMCLSSITVTGCSNSQQDEIARLDKSYVLEQQKNVELEKEKAVLSESLESANKRVEKQVSIITSLSKDSANEMNIYSICTGNIDDYSKVIDFYITMPKELSLKSKLSTIAETISEAYFSNLPIKVLEIDDKKIATVNLEEMPESSTDTSMKQSNSWSTSLFQGSTGGTITRIRLAESFLQKDYKGEWIEGIRFLYKGQRIDFQHVPELSEVIYRR
ncbi:hypothetical protein E4K67_01985 [Desulfosporosinus fructosivorans]|uniref:Lipoprotein n=1 Tax=Desulfosporosinus fructosivorans TaxID=2018669 RepID=A0A4Z0RBE7_9FIRM|nr:hypothetical protein [Desulfosporosinus fructosivorans]TGE39784.1 hypothetical protein E4K67_01985 [Desulfosporosinus fructosivorans]